MFDLASWFILGCIGGTISGLLPGLHVNTFITIFLSIAIANSDNFGFMVFLIVAATVQSFVDFIPTIYFGVPDEDTYSPLLPGHKLVLKGLGPPAFLSTILGSCLAIIFTILSIPLLIFIYTLLYGQGPLFIGLILLFFFGFILFHEERKKYTRIFLVIFFSTILSVLGSSSSIQHDMFIFSILTGCFGASSIILSIIKKTKLRPQKITKKLAISKIDAIKFSLKGTILGNFVAGLPGLSCAHVSFLVRPKSGLMLLMVVLGAINTSALISGLVILFFLGKKRSGLAIAISTLASTLDPNLFIFFIVIILGATFYAIFICDFLNTQIPKILQNLNYVWLSAGNLLFIIILVILLGGSEALIFLVLATSLGISCYYLQVKRVYCMCFLFIPVLLHYLIGIDLWSMS